MLADEAHGFDQLRLLGNRELEEQVVTVLNSEIVQVRERNGRDRKRLTQVLKRRS
jgi:hypothetical protein